MKRIVVAVLIALVVMGAAFADDTAAKKQAQTSGLQWVSVIDNSNYAGSYDSAAAMFKAAVTKEQWVRSLDAVRTPLGKVVSRNLASATYATSLPGAPDGQYVVLRFNTSFSFKKTAVETLTMALDKDGQWRAAGYFIK